MTAGQIPCISGELLSQIERRAVTYLPDVPTWTVMVPVHINLAVMADALTPCDVPRTVTIYRSDPPDFIIDGIWEVHATGVAGQRWVAWRRRGATK